MILAIVCGFMVPSCFRTISEDLESSEKFPNRPEDLESSGKFSASSGSFQRTLEIFYNPWKFSRCEEVIWLVAGQLRMLQQFSQSAGVFEAWERSFLRNGAISKLQSMLCAWEK